MHRLRVRKCSGLFYPSHYAFWKRRVLYLFYYTHKNTDLRASENRPRHKPGQNQPYLLHRSKNPKQRQPQHHVIIHSLRCNLIKQNSMLSIRPFIMLRNEFISEKGNPNQLVLWTDISVHASLQFAKVPE